MGGHAVDAGLERAAQVGGAAAGAVHVRNMDLDVRDPSFEAGKPLPICSSRRSSRSASLATWLSV
jgi:hypothetical protein